MSALKTLALVVLAVMLGSVTTELLAGGSALVWLALPLVPWVMRAVPVVAGTGRRR